MVLNENENYVIAIPSYKRNEVIMKYTLKVLQEHKINLNKIYVFVAGKIEQNLYFKTLPEEYHKNIIIGKKGLFKQRNFISTFFPKNQYIVQMDDDIRDITQLVITILK